MAFLSLLLSMKPKKNALQIKSVLFLLIQQVFRLMNNRDNNSQIVSGLLNVLAAVRSCFYVPFATITFINLTF